MPLQVSSSDVEVTLRCHKKIAIIAAWEYNRDFSENYMKHIKCAPQGHTAVSECHTREILIIAL